MSEELQRQKRRNNNKKWNSQREQRSPQTHNQKLTIQKTLTEAKKSGKTKDKNEYKHLKMYEEIIIHPKVTKLYPKTQITDTETRKTDTKTQIIDPKTQETDTKTQIIDTMTNVKRQKQLHSAKYNKETKRHNHNPVLKALPHRLTQFFFSCTDTSHRLHLMSAAMKGSKKNNSI